MIDLATDLDRDQLIRKFEYLETAGGALTIDEVRTLPAGRFSVLDRLNRRISKADHWLHARVRNPSALPVTWVMQHMMPVTDHVDYWIFRGGELVQHANGGDRTLKSERQVPYRIPSARYTSLPNETVDLYIRVHNMNAAPVHLVFVLDSEPSFLGRIEQDQLLLGILYGIPLSLALSALAGWVVAGIRSIEVPVYVAYVLSVLCSWIAMNGQMAEYIFIDRPDLDNSMQHVFFMLVPATMAVYARRFLRTRELMPRFDLVFKIIILLAVAGIALRFAGVYTFVIRITILVIILSLVTPLAAWRALRKGIVYARWYLFAQLLYTLALVVGIVGSNFGKLSYQYFLYCEIALFGELLLLGVAQYDRMRILKNERMQVERRYQAALEETNAELQREMERRTRHLQEAYRRSQFLTEVKVTTRRIADGEFSVRLKEGDTADMRDLANSVNSMAESLSRLEGARRRWIAEISHELRTPLFALMCETEALLDGVRELNKKAIGSLHEEILHLSDLVTDLHELALSYLRPLPCTFTPWRLDEVTHKLKVRYDDLARNHGLTFELSVADAGCIVKWDKGRIEQLLSNLVQNSISYTDAPGKIAMAITVISERACIEIEDSPPGVNTEEVQHLFEPLYRADAARSRRSGGSGLGLSICQAIVQAHNGRIIAAPSSMGGLAIRIDLPLALEENG